MQHLMVDDIFQRVSRNAGMIEYTANDDGVMRRIVVGKTSTGLCLTPRHLRASQQAVKKLAVQPFKNFLQVVNMTLRRGDSLSAANLSDKVRL